MDSRILSETVLKYKCYKKVYLVILLLRSVLGHFVESKYVYQIFVTSNRRPVLLLYNCKVICLLNYSGYHLQENGGFTERVGY